MTGPRYPLVQKKAHESYLLETCVPGIFTAGDSRAGTKARVAVAVGEGSMVIKFVHQYWTAVAQMAWGRIR